MKIKHMLKKTNTKIQTDFEQAHYIILSLYRAYSVGLLKNPAQKETYITAMRQIKKDLQNLSEDELIAKAVRTYQPVLQKLKTGDIKR